MTAPCSANSPALSLELLLGTASCQTNSSTASSATRAYDAFGALTASAGTPKGPFGFAGAHGYQEDADSGLKLLGRRYYDSSTGRFLTRDKIKDGRNWYSYCEGNPLKWVDPEGLRAYYVGVGGHLIIGIISISVHIDVYIDPDEGGAGIGIGGGLGPGLGLYGGVGLEGGYDGSADVNTGNTSNWATRAGEAR